MTSGSFKDLENVIIKSTYQMEINGKTIEPGETILMFDKIQIANFKEIKEHVSARGGYQNAPRVFWDTTKEIQFVFAQGVFSREQFALMNNAKIIKTDGDLIIPIYRRRKIEADDDGKIYLNLLEKNYENNQSSTIIAYNNDWEKVTDFTVEANMLQGFNPYQEIILDYTYNYNNSNSSRVSIGKELTGGFLSLQGETRIQDENSGEFKTVIINIPKFRLMSNLSMQLGRDAVPVVSTLEGVACPYGSRGNQYCMEMNFLDEEVDETYEENYNR